MESDTPSESTFSADEGLDEDVDDPYSSLLSNQYAISMFYHFNEGCHSYYRSRESY